jgi:methylase of polypeptide subunit release factors
VPWSWRLSDVLRDVDGQFDLIVSNPPYMRDSDARTYRDGGADYGAELSSRIVADALPRLVAGGTLIVYTGSAIVRGRDTFRARIEPALRRCSGTIVYEELDPDVFGQALDERAYADVERIAAVGLRVRVR